MKKQNNSRLKAVSNGSEMQSKMNRKGFLCVFVSLWLKSHGISS